MAWHLTSDVDEFAATAGEFLASRPVEHTVLLTLVDTLRRRGLHAYGTGDPIFGSWRTPTGAVSGVLLETPPHPVNFSALPAEAVPPAAEALAGRPLTGANLLADAVDTFVTAWGARAEIVMRSRLYRLGTLTAPTRMPPGAARGAGPGDRELVTRWMSAFYADIGESHQAPAVLPDDVLLWETDGEPAALVTRSRAAAGAVRIQHVYTPPERRGRGFAGALTAAATQGALDAGATEVVLFTDLANQTSNGLYRRLGYQPVEDRTVVEFAP
jgi:ribosomal protein S18 acetylase RimI-like enzyme